MLGTNASGGGRRPAEQRTRLRTKPTEDRDHRNRQAGDDEDDREGELLSATRRVPDGLPHLVDRLRRSLYESCHILSSTVERGNDIVTTDVVEVILRAVQLGPTRSAVGRAPHLPPDTSNVVYLIYRLRWRLVRESAPNRVLPGRTTDVDRPAVGVTEMRSRGRPTDPRKRPGGESAMRRPATGRDGRPCRDDRGSDQLEREPTDHPLVELQRRRGKQMDSATSREARFPREWTDIGNESAERSRR